MKHCSTHILLLLLSCLVPSLVWSQTVSDKLLVAYQSFAADPQLYSASTSLYVIDAKTGHVVLDKNGNVGLAPASTQKIITSVSAYELLGKEFRYQTRFALDRSATGNALVVMPSGDPTLGSWRWPVTHETAIINGLTQAIKKMNVPIISEVYVDNSGWNEEMIPDGWMWQDIGNYYGAGPAKLNWRENQYDVILKSGKNIGDPVRIASTIPPLQGLALRSELTAAAAGTGDNAYIYFPLNAATGVIRGTIPVNETNFKISGAIPDPADQLVSTLRGSLATMGIKALAEATTLQKGEVGNYPVFHTITSPPLDSIIFWFNKKSINLYGEALVKTIAYKQKEVSATNEGIKIIRNFWKQKGIPEAELNLVDGSGLSPLNRVTTQAQVHVLQYARNQPWFQGFYAALPVYNGMKMKSGTIRGVKGFCGYHRGNDGKEYIFSFLVNNYNGSSSGIVQKMYKVLDVLK